MPDVKQSFPLTHHKAKRKRGAQKGNQNARKHGFYSGTLGVAEAREFWNIANMEGLDTEIAVFRVKLRSVLQHDPGNLRVLREASMVLTNWLRAKYGLDRSHSNYLKKFVRGTLQNHGALRDAGLDAKHAVRLQRRTGCAELRSVLTKRIKRTLTIE